MKAEEIRFHRLEALQKIYEQSGMNDQAVLNRAQLMGVSEPTAKSYLKTIKARVLK